MGQVTDAAGLLGSPLPLSMNSAIAWRPHSVRQVTRAYSQALLPPPNLMGLRPGGGEGAIMLSSASEHVQGLAGLPWGTWGEMIAQPPGGSSVVDTSLLGSLENVRPWGLPGRAAHKPEELQGTGPPRARAVYSSWAWLRSRGSLRQLPDLTCRPSQ